LRSRSSKSFLSVNLVALLPSIKGGRQRGEMETVLTTLADIAATGGLAENAAAQDFDHLVRLHQRRIYRVLFSLVRDPDLADNLTQECFLRAYQKWDTFRGEARVETWLIRIAVNLARDQGRSRRWQFWRSLVRQPATAENGTAFLETTDPGPSVEQALLAREQLAAVKSILRTLPLQQRTVFSLRFFEEMSLEEIAQTMELEVGTIKAHLFRAISKVRKAVKEQNKK